MTPRDFLARLLVLLALLGVLMAPLGASIAAPMMQGHPHAMDMSADMPCCPDEGSASSGCKGDCPFVALCVAGHIAVLAPAAIATGHASVLDRHLAPAPDSPLPSRTSEPPARPPRI